MSKKTHISTMKLKIAEDRQKIYELLNIDKEAYNEMMFEYAYLYLNRCFELTMQEINEGRCRTKEDKEWDKKIIDDAINKCAKLSDFWNWWKAMYYYLDNVFLNRVMITPSIDDAPVETIVEEYLQQHVYRMNFYMPKNVKQQLINKLDEIPESINA